MGTQKIEYAFGANEEVCITANHVCLYFYHGIFSNFYTEEFIAPLKAEDTYPGGNSERAKMSKALAYLHTTHGDNANDNDNPDDTATDLVLAHRNVYRLFRFRCGEQYIMCRKAILMGDRSALVAIFNATNPMAIKKLGRRVRNWDQELWDANVENIAREVCMFRMQSIPKISQFLLEQICENPTKILVVAESSPRDIIWGTGLSITSSHKSFKIRGIFRRANGEIGRNILGRAYVHALEMIYGLRNKKLRARIIAKYSLPLKYRSQ